MRIKGNKKLTTKHKRICICLRKLCIYRLKTLNSTYQFFFRLRCCLALQVAAADEKTAYHLAQMSALNLIVSYLDCPWFLLNRYAILALFILYFVKISLCYLILLERSRNNFLFS